MFRVSESCTRGYEALEVRQLIAHTSRHCTSAEVETDTAVVEQKKKLAEEQAALEPVLAETERMRKAILDQRAADQGARKATSAAEPLF